MTLLHLLSYLGGLAAFLFVTLSLASGLLWLAELIEEHSRYAKTIGIRAIYGIIILHALLFIFDRLPILPILFSIACHLVYLQNFSSTWPYISLTSPRFLLSCVLVVADHFIWFFHFAGVAQEAKKYRGPKYRYGGAAQTKETPTFMDVAAFFAVCVWFVPLFLFLSLSANDNVIPSFDSSAPPSPSGLRVDLSSPAPGARPAKRSTSLVKSILTPLLSLLPRLRRRGAADGIIAPHTPVRGSPLQSPVPMQAGSYFPWDGNASLSPATSRPSSASGHRTPPPPKRVQSEAQMKAGINPRGVATRDGVPAAEEGTGLGIKNGLGAAGRRQPSRPSSPSMSLGPAGAGGVAPAEVVDAKRKAD